MDSFSSTFDLNDVSDETMYVSSISCPFVERASASESSVEDGDKSCDLSGDQVRAT